MIYLNAASHGLCDSAVRARMIAYLQREDQIGPAKAEREAQDEMTGARAMAARAIGASEADVMLLGTTTIGWNAAVRALPLADRRVLVAPGEWTSDVAVLARMGARIEVMPTDETGDLDVSAIAGLIDDDLAAICAPQVCSLTGETYCLSRIGALPRPHGCLFIVDAAQSLGQLPVSVADLGADILAATTRKWIRGPRDTALLYVAPQVFEQMAPNPAPRIAGLSGGGQSIADKPGIARFSPGDGFAPLRLGLGVALSQFLADPDEAMAAPARLAAHLRSGLRELRWQLACADDARATAITTLTGSPERIGAVTAALKRAGYAFASPSPDCEPLRGIDPGMQAFLRLSPHGYNTLAEIDLALAIIARA